MSTTATWIKDIAPLATAAAALLVASGQYLTTRKKTKLEIEKLGREISNLSEATKINASNLSELQDAFVEQLPTFNDEVVLYQNTTGSVGFDFRVSEGHRYNGDNQKVGEAALATTIFGPDGTITVERKNCDGRVELFLVRYGEGAEKSEYIERDESGAGPRKLRVSCEVRSITGDHVLRCVLRDAKTTKWHGSTSHRISSPTWKRVESYFTLPPLVPGSIRLDLLEPSQSPSSLQIRKLMVTERNAAW